MFEAHGRARIFRYFVVITPAKQSTDFRYVSYLFVVFSYKSRTTKDETSVRQITKHPYGKITKNPFGK